MVVNSKGKLALVVTRKVGDGSFLPYTGEYQSSDSSLLRLLSPVNNRTKGASSSLVNITPPGIACRDPGAKCQETSALCNPVPSRTSRMPSSAGKKKKTYRLCRTGQDNRAY